MIKRSVPQIIVILMLLWALYPHNPYGYYTLLRLVCCGVFGYLVYAAVVEKMTAWAWLFSITALIYNPFVSVHFTRDIWTGINLITVGFAIASIWILSPPKAQNITPAKTEDKDPKSSRRPPPKIEPTLTLEQRAQNHPHPRYFLQMQRDILAGPAEPGYDDDPLEHLGELWEELDAMVIASCPKYEALRQPLPPRPFILQKREPFSGEAFLDCEPEEQTALLLEAGEVLSKQYPIDTNLLETFKLVVKNLSLPQPTKDKLLQVFIFK